MCNILLIQILSWHGSIILILLPVAWPTVGSKLRRLAFAAAEISSCNPALFVIQLSIRMWCRRYPHHRVIARVDLPHGQRTLHVLGLAALISIPCHLAQAWIHKTLLMCMLKPLPVWDYLLLSFRMGSWTKIKKSLGSYFLALFVSHLREFSLLVPGEGVS